MGELNLVPKDHLACETDLALGYCYLAESAGMEILGLGASKCVQFCQELSDI